MEGLTLFVVIVWILFNIATSKIYSAGQLKKMIYSGYCTAGKIFASIFYAPAWFLKGVRVVVLATIK